MDFLLGGVSASAACLVTNPLEVVKTRMQVQGELKARGTYQVKTHLQTQSSSSIAVGHQYSYTSAIEGLASIVRHGGPSALWRGVTGAVPRVAVGSAVQLSTFTAAKTRLASAGLLPAGGWLESLAAAALSSVAVVAAMTPLDVVSTRLYNQPAQHRIYRGFADCLLRTWRAEGLRGLYKGVGACYFRLGPHTVLSLLLWDEARKAARRLQL